MDGQQEATERRPVTRESGWQTVFPIDEFYCPPAGITIV